MTAYPSGPESGATPDCDLWLDESPRPQSVLEAELERKQHNYGNCPGCGAWVALEGRTHCLSCMRRESETADLSPAENGTDTARPALAPVGHAEKAIAAIDKASGIAKDLLAKLRAEQPHEPAWIWNDDALELRVPKLEARIEKLETQIANMEGVLAMAVHVANRAADIAKGRVE